MYGHRCQDTQSPFRVRARSFRVTSSLITRVWTESNIIKFLWLIDTEWRHKILYCYTLQAKQLVTLGTPSSGSWLCQQSSSSQAGLGTAWPEHQERGETERREPALAPHGGRGRPVEPGWPGWAATWLLATWHPAQADSGAGRRVAGTRCRPGQSPEGHRPGNTRQLPSPRLQSLVSPCPVSQSRLISERSSAVIELDRDFFAVYQSFKKQWRDQIRESDKSEICFGWKGRKTGPDQTRTHEEIKRAMCWTSVTRLVTCVCQNA